MSAELHHFVDPPWNYPLDVKRVIAGIPADATIAGMFFLAVLDGAVRRGMSLPQARPRYLRFGFYPLSEFAELLVAAAERFYPHRPIRQALRELGMGGPRAFSGSVLGKVTLGSADDVHAAIAAIAKTYAINVRPSSCTILDTSERSMVLSLEQVHHFLDSHHVGVFEGTLEHAGVRGRVRIASRSRVSAELLLEWER